MLGSIQKHGEFPGLTKRRLKSFLLLRQVLKHNKGADMRIMIKIVFVGVVAFHSFNTQAKCLLGALEN